MGLGIWSGVHSGVRFMIMIIKLFSSFKTSEDTIKSRYYTQYNHDPISCSILIQSAKIFLIEKWPSFFVWRATFKIFSSWPVFRLTSTWRADDKKDVFMTNSSIFDVFRCFTTDDDIFSEILTPFSLSNTLNIRSF